MKIHIASDHAGFDKKEYLKQELNKAGYSIFDHGAFELDINDDYPDFITPCAQAVANDPDSIGIILGGSGQGEQMNANKIPNVRAAEYYGGNIEIVKLARQHNNANVLSLGARFLNNIEALDAVKIFIQTPFTQEPRHTRRLQKIFNLFKKK
jgi:ribose 5-phosphate isomerase B